MEKKYLVGYVFGREALMWDDVKDFEESFDEDTGLTTIKFKENNVEYTYVGNESKGYREQNNKAPYISGYKLMGRRTALRHDYLDDRKRRPAASPRDIDDEEDFDLSEDDFEIIRDFIQDYDTPTRDNSCGNSYTCGNPGYHYRHTGCGISHSNCGRSYSGSCGGGGC